MTDRYGNRPPGTLAPTGESHTADDYRIYLNFLPVGSSFPNFAVYRKPQVLPQDPRPTPESMAYRLPPAPGAVDAWPSYWVSLDPVDGFERFEAAPDLNTYLTCRVLFWALIAATKRVLQPEQFHTPDNAFIEEVSFVQRTYAEGDERLEVQPYYLRSTRQFGYLLDYHFRLRDGVPFSRKVQQLSLSLDGSFRRNLDYYVDRDSKVRAFLAERQDVFESLRLPGTDSALSLDGDFAALPADRLRTKTYVFAGNRESRSQFSGLRDWGPLQPLEAPPRLLFIFREQDRQAARMLARWLRGTHKRERFSFPGFNALFKCDMEVDSNPIVLPNLHRGAMEKALERVKVDMQSRRNTLPVLVLPADDDAYLLHKALFSREGISTQVCTLRILQDESSLKWVVANIALQIFCKAGGYPWKVRPAATERSLIIGISQSHKLRKVDGKTRVEKYFAFSVMTDSSGLFQKIQVLGDHEQPDYLTKLRQNLCEILNESAGAFSRVVIHTSFKLKHTEIDAIQKTVQEVANSPDLARCRFAVVKVNHRSRFFGVNRGANSLVPYEATRVKLGPREYLVWFEGIFPDRPTVTKKFPGPTHLQILRVSDENTISDDSLLQDLVNLSGANWRGFNAKSAPVSVFYCHLVADMVHDFHERELPMPAVKDIRPWFCEGDGMSSRSKDIMFLLGAGASAEAGIPTSAEMIDRIDRLLSQNEKWKPFRDLYHHVKSAIYYSAGLRGQFNNQVSYNIETLVNTLYELEKNEDHPLYPFIATWNSRFVALASPDFGRVREFRHLILAALKKWMCPEDTAQANYYHGLATLQEDLNFPLPVFSLNYDLCVERLADHNFRLETGFAGYGSRHVWDWERFEVDGPNPPPQILLYKLHGSINWKRDEATKDLFCVEQVENIDPDRMEVIFGRDFKLEAADPYLFYAYEFRRYALIAKLIVVVGYGFGDVHINKMLTQGLRDNPDRQMLAVQTSDGNGDNVANDIHNRLELSNAEKNQVSVQRGTAKEFMDTPDLAKSLLDRIPKGADAPF